ncbi:MAG: 50S ribosomal protein L31 [Anaerolineales bacterium]|nr:50S ribosomal protein L31 [Anaerolineales bacterium]MCW5854524.1 50S ribosomal protein L31 [Anaerolineales bacterium]
MKEAIHPKYFADAKVTCACGNSWTTGSTKQELRVDICSACHPFYTGVQRIVDTEGQVDRFYKRLEVRNKHKEELDAKSAAQTSPDRTLAELDLSKRTLDAYKKAGIENAGQFIELLAQGDQAVLDIDGVGAKALADTKKALRRLGYDLPEAAPAEAEAAE